MARRMLRLDLEHLLGLLLHATLEILAPPLGVLGKNRIVAECLPVGRTNSKDSFGTGLNCMDIYKRPTENE